MSWSLKRLFGWRRECGNCADLEQVIARRDKLVLDQESELRQTRRQLSAWRGKCEAAMVQYARACTDVDTERRKRITAEADVKELTGQREDQAARIEELERELADATATIDGLGLRVAELEKGGER